MYSLVNPFLTGFHTPADISSNTPAMAYISLLNAQISQSKDTKKDALIRAREKLIKLYNLPKPSRKGGTNGK
jgi:hypothetical protein